MGICFSGRDCGVSAAADCSKCFPRFLPVLSPGGQACAAVRRLRAENGGFRRGRKILRPPSGTMERPQKKRQQFLRVRRGRRFLTRFPQFKAHPVHDGRHLALAGVAFRRRRDNRDIYQLRAAFRFFGNRLGGVVPVCNNIKRGAPPFLQIVSIPGFFASGPVISGNPSGFAEESGCRL